jgi:hypothetical protein
MGAPIQRL